MDEEDQAFDTSQFLGDRNVSAILPVIYLFSLMIIQFISYGEINQNSNSRLRDITIYQKLQNNINHIKENKSLIAIKSGKVCNYKFFKVVIFPRYGGSVPLMLQFLRILPNNKIDKIMLLVPFA